MARRGENIYKRKDGRYEGRYIKYYDASGKAVYGYIYSKNYAEVKEKMVKQKNDKNKVRVSSNVKLGEWVNMWFASQGVLKPTTRRVYKSHIENNIIPHLGNIPLKNLNCDRLQDFVNSLELSAATVKTVFTILKSALKAGEDKGLIGNIWSRVKLPKKERRIVKVLSSKEQTQLENTLSRGVDTGILISLYTGLRIGEVCALKWKDIDFDAGILTVNGTQARTENGVEIISPKSKTSKREVPIPSFLLKKLAEEPRKTDFVISKNLKPIDIRTYRRYFKSVLKKSELPDIKYHSLRHTFAPRALEVGIDYKTLSEILGHASVGITLDLYAHSLKEHKIKEMSKLDGIYKH